MARRFVFRFETLLKIRRQREDEHKRIVAARLREIEKTRQHLACLDEQIRRELSAIRQGQEPGRLDMHQIIRHRHWLGRLHKAVLDTRTHLQFLEARLAAERAALAEAVRQVRILEKLKERQWQRARLEEQRQETRVSDEMATARYIFDAQAVT